MGKKYSDGGKGSDVRTSNFSAQRSNFNKIKGFSSSLITERDDGNYVTLNGQTIGPMTWPKAKKMIENQP
jgi:hypothetical protein